MRILFRTLLRRKTALVS
uniref:Uncharacterized protein n=1 Tax=Anguilla anguilla TaxID=7936 RepID=A0A0E9USU9_ANGAN